MIKNLCFFEKRIGVEVTDKEIYVINEKPDPNKYINLAQLVQTNGGLLRIPFLAKSNGLIYIIKSWGKQILHIIRTINQQGLVLSVLRLHDFYISKDGLKIVLSNVKGIGKVSHFGTINELPDISINLPMYKGPNCEEGTKTNQQFNIPPYKRDENTGAILFDPYIAPETIFRKTLQNSQYIDTWIFGCLLYEILFGVPPKSFVREIQEFQKSSSKEPTEINLKYSPDHPSKKPFKFANPSSYFFYEIFQDLFTEYILEHDYQIVKKRRTNMAIAMDRISYGMIFSDIFKNLSLQKKVFYKEDIHEKNIEEKFRDEVLKLEDHSTQSQDKSGYEDFNQEHMVEGKNKGKPKKLKQNRKSKKQPIDKKLDLEEITKQQRN